METLEHRQLLSHGPFAAFPGPTQIIQLPKLLATRIVVSPATLSLADATSFSYTATAYDQFGDPMVAPPAFTWSLGNGSVGGTLNTAGKFIAPSTGTGSNTIQASIGDVTGTAAVNVTAAGVFGADRDIGAPPLPGHYAVSGSAYSVSGSGSDIFNATDQFNFPSLGASGNTILEARVLSVGNTDPWAKAGLMFRASVAADSMDVYLTKTPAGVVQLLNRTASGINATVIGAATPTVGATWLKLVRAGNNFTGLYSTDGTNWNSLGTTTLSMNSSVLAGLVASSHSATKISTSTFDNVLLISQPVSSVYRLSTRGLTTMSLDVAGFGNTNSTAVQMWNANFTSNQQWYVESQGDGTYKIYAYSGENSLQMLDLTNGNTSNGTLVNTYTDNNNSAQRWIFLPVGGGYYRIVPKNGENTLQTLDMQNGNSASAGSRANMYSYYGGDNQVFSLLAPGALQVLASPKKGVAGNLNQSSAIHNAWGYDWGAGGSVPTGVEYDPMVWGYYGNNNNDFTNWYNGVLASHPKALLGFNEPDGADQANLSVSAALQGWGLMQSATVPLVSPAAVHADDSWMQSFMSGAAAAGYRVDAVAIHWYGGNDPSGFINYVNYIHTLYNKPVWITEFCPADWSGNHGVSVAQATSFMQTVVPQLNSMSFVQRYSWFSASPGDGALGQGALFNNDGSLTALGTLYSRL